MIQKSIFLPYSSAQMFDLVADVDKYSEFMPWCGGSKIQHKNEQGILASIIIDFRGIYQKFSTWNQHCFPNYINLELVEGPFSSLTGKWEFQDFSEKYCKVCFTMEYTFSNTIIKFLISPIFNNIASSFIDSFIKRAKFIYG
ncbi:MAG: type II toxin-antitoxin system RatA family toxin [Bordetella sp.]|nr:MAG: type II toxin-antitoxin system RatA family toxin [Bordetella sp.]